MSLFTKLGKLTCIGLLILLFATTTVPLSIQVAQAASRDANVASQITAVFGPDAPAAIRVATCESGLNPNAYNPTPVGNSHAEGVFQVLFPSTWSTTPEAGANPYDSTANINAAHAIFARDGNSWREWQCQP